MLAAWEWVHTDHVLTLVLIVLFCANGALVILLRKSGVAWNRAEIRRAARFTWWIVLWASVSEGLDVFAQTSPEPFNGMLRWMLVLEVSLATFLMSLYRIKRESKVSWGRATKPR